MKNVLRRAFVSVPPRLGNGGFRADIVTKPSVDQKVGLHNTFHTKQKKKQNCALLAEAA